MSISEILFYGGLVLMGGAFFCAVSGILFFGIVRRKLKEKLDQEYGKEEHS